MWLGKWAAGGWSVRSAGAIVLAATAALSASAQTPPAGGAGKPTPPVVGGTGTSATAAAAANKARSADALLQQGIDALSAGQYAIARDAFQDVVTLDPKNGRAFHGLALCLMVQKEIAKAAVAFDKGFAATPNPDRAMALNAAACNLAIRNNMRAAKVVREYLAARPKEVDEAMVNALGTALHSATPQERKDAFFTQCASFYEVANKRLEAARPGYKRFGAQWLPARDADAKEAAIASKRRQLDSLAQAVTAAEERFAVADKEMERQKFLVTRGEAPDNPYLRSAEINLDSAKTALTAAREKYEGVAGTVELPTFPAKVELVAIDSTTAPPLETTAVAANANSGANAEVKPLRPRPIRTKRAETATPPKPGDAAPTAEPPVAMEPPRRIRRRAADGLRARSADPIDAGPPVPRPLPRGGGDEDRSHPADPPRRQAPPLNRRHTSL